ncbi:MAG: aminotransferase class V-fold PLP-dependent enzyme [Clostridia bacterium]|nr:aminotransferase class V-fold PLP-dependent enzyme [Clostridia bacterium]
MFSNDEIGKTFIEGGTGINSLELDMPDFLPERYEGGTLSTPAIVGLCEGIKWVNSIGIDKIRMHEEGLYTLLLDLLSIDNRMTTYQMKSYAGNALLFNVGSLSSAYVASELNKRDIYVRSGYQCSPLAHKILNTGEGGAVRVSFGVFNTKKDVYSLYEALCEIVKNKK